MENDERLVQEAADAEEVESAAVASIKTFTEAEMAAARAAWEAESALRLSALEESLAAERRARLRRETEIRCAGFLRERSLDESLCGMILAENEAEVADETLLLRVEALSGAVEAAAIRLLRGRAGEGRPRGGEGVPLRGEWIRNTPVAQLSQLMQNP